MPTTEEKVMGLSEVVEVVFEEELDIIDIVEVHNP